MSEKIVKIQLTNSQSRMMMTIRIHREIIFSYWISLFLFLLLVLCSPMNSIPISPFAYHQFSNSTTTATSTTNTNTKIAAGITTFSVTESAWDDDVALQQSRRCYIDDGESCNRHNDDNIVNERMNEKEDSNDALSLNPPAVVRSTTHRMMKTTNCITNETRLRSAINNAPNFSSTDIEICTNYMKIDTSQPNVITGKRGINIVNKFLHFHCVLPNQTEKCTLDAQDKARHFAIDNATVSFDRMTFMNGKGTNETGYYSYYNGGALWINSSTIEINYCHFFANKASFGDGGGYGGAIYVEYSSILLGHINMNNNDAVRIKTRRCCTIMIFHVI
jgi:hypothetical protein